MKKLLALMLLLALLFTSYGIAQAQDYYFQLPQKVVHAYWETDGTLTLDYTYVFKNDPSGHSIEFVDVGLPNGSFNEDNVSATINGKPVDYVSSSEFQGEGSSGVAVALGSNSIPPGQTGTVRVRITRIKSVLHPDSQDKNYASAVLIPNYFLSSVVYGPSDMTVTFHFPAGVQPAEPRWHTSPAGFPSEPETGIDGQGDIYYTWYNAAASPSSKYTFGASFPASYVPDSAIVRFDFGAWLDANLCLIIPAGIFGLFILSSVGGVVSSRRRQMQYLPPKISIEGHGIKRGLTAVEAAILLEQPLDKVLTMILFGVLKKNAADVISQDPLNVKPVSPLPADLNDYEIAFLKAFEFATKKEQQNALATMSVGLVQGVSEKMKGFSRKETIEYYKNIVERAWAQVQEADTPEVKSKKYDELMEWTMLDRNYEDRTRDVFRQSPVYLPMWWGHYSPSYRTASASRPSTASMPSSGSGGGMPHLPGSDFAASVVNGATNFSAGVIGNVSQFTNKVTSRTNPVPVATTSSRGSSYRGGGGRSSGGGRSCACACACAGCACACAGGGR